MTKPALGGLCQVLHRTLYFLVAGVRSYIFHIFDCTLTISDRSTSPSRLGRLCDYLGTGLALCL